jgi:Cu+-exporting ATPase
LSEAGAAESAIGRSIVLVAWDGQARGLVSVADTAKPTAAKAIAAYRSLGLRPILLSGDSTAAAQHLADQLGITDVVAEVSPAGKVAKILELQQAGATVAMVGDGVNDAAALAQADLGIALGSGTDAAIAASDLTLMGSDPVHAADAIRLSRVTLGRIKGNLFWAFAYNIAAIPIAAAGLLNPMIASAAMAFSSVFVVSNSLRLRRFQPLP